MAKDQNQKADLDNFLLALDTWATNNGDATVKCDECGSIIRFKTEGSTTWHECDCGKFNGVLRGL